MSSVPQQQTPALTSPSTDQPLPELAAPSDVERPAEESLEDLQAQLAVIEARMAKAQAETRRILENIRENQIKLDIATCELMLCYTGDD